MTTLKKLRAPALFVTACLLCLSLPPAQAQETTVPVGYVTLTIAAGTGSVKKVTPISIPFYDFIAGMDGQIKGQISGVTASTLVNTSADWTPAQLSNAASPYLIKLTSGAATGRTFLISTAVANTATAVTIDAKDIAQGALTTLGIAAGDSYEIFPCDTLGSFFGTPETSGVEGGPNVNNADSLMISSNGALDTYFYSTTLNRWTRSILGSPNATDTPLRPDAGIWYSRRAASEMTLVIPGRVPTTRRMATVKNSGATILSQHWPVDTMLINSNIHQIPTWTAAAAVASADKVQLVVDGETRTYWYDGAHWRRQTDGSPIADNVVIPAGAAVFINQLGTAAGYSTVTQSLPYNLD